MTDPLTPPTELVHKWALEAEDEHQPTVAYSLVGQLAAKAAQWGAGQELEACAKWVQWWDDLTAACQLRAARRPKPPSLKEQALERCNDYIDPDGIIRRALNELSDN